MKILLIGLCGFCLTACTFSSSFNTTNTVANTANTANTATNTSVNTIVVNANTNTAANTAANANAVKPVDNGPKRITFGKGQSSAAENMVLVPGESKQFVIGAKAGQILTIDSSAKEATVTMLSKGKSTTEDAEDGSLTATLDKDGDFIFEVKNSTKKEFKTSVNVTINTEGDD